MTKTQKNNREISIWLFVICAMVFAMVIVGGVTRLTESGLSMVKWHPIHGIIPPISAEEWHEEFTAYKQYPEYQKINAGMSLSEFKAIFYWEYSHRILGRLIGLVFFVPFLLFLIMGKVEKKLKPKLWIMFSLGALQGLVGWWMVKSGLVNNPDVSHYRLTTHLGLAILIYIYAFWHALNLFGGQLAKPIKFNMVTILIGLVFFQILLGGLVAGLNAGMVYNQWPLMDGELIPSGMFSQSPAYINLFENITTVQFNHRMLAYIITIFAIFTWFKLHQSEDKLIKISANYVIIAISAQVLLGILTLIYAVPIPLAASHQAGSVVLLSFILVLLKRI